jgi:hypothetical protein
LKKLWDFEQELARDRAGKQCLVRVVYSSRPRPHMQIAADGRQQTGRTSSKIN